jgi:two-component system chemotaxis response regulator CheB
MPIRVLIVEDSLIALTILKRILDQSPQIEVVGTARTGLEALALIPQTQPDVICTDLHMPQMDGLEFTREVMSRDPRPILVISASVQEEDTHHIFRLLEAGAVDVFPKPAAGLTTSDRTFSQLLVNKIEVLAGVRVFKKHRPSLPQTGQSTPRSSPSSTFKVHPRFKIVAIGASTGGPLALQQIFSALPPDFPLPILCVQHISFGFLQGLIDWLSLSCPLPIQIAQSGEQPCSGKIYFPVKQHHLELDAQGRFVCTNSPLVDGHRPSVTTTFQSIARLYGKKAIGILLTGMGRDGATGLLEVNRTGGLTIAQDQATSVVFGMPQEAIKLGAANQVLPIQAIAPTLLALLKGQPQNVIAR